MNFQSSVIRSEVLRHGSIDTREGRFFHVASLNFSFALLMGCFADV